MHPNAKNKVGQRFGRLVVVREAGRTDNRFVRWECICDCGKTCTVSGNHLQRRGTTSCGCYAIERLKARNLARRGRSLLPEGEAPLNNRISHCRSSARKRGLEWALTKEQCRTLFASPCEYCGCPPAHEYAYCRARPYGGVLVYNGIDRVDSSKGYTPENVVPCCSRCNWAKSDMDVEEFAAWAQRVAVRMAYRMSHQPLTDEQREELLAGAAA